MSEIRQNKATRQWVIFSPARGKRPRDFHGTAKGRIELPEHDNMCPFCPGNEHLLPPVIFNLKKRNGWMTRVVPNKFPAVSPHGEIMRSQTGIYITMQGYGHHEVIIETPYHNRDTGLMSEEEVGAIIETYHRRYCDLMKGDQNMMVIIFRNHGERAGTSLIHPHSQLIATGMVPQHIRWRESEAGRHFDNWGRCVYCDILEYELKDKRRIIHENRLFVALIPFAAEVPFETWIIPKRHKADFGDITDREKEDLAAVLRDMLHRMTIRLNDPDYNYIINTSARYRAKEPQLHWYLQIRPRLMTIAGFEIGSGISINPSMPEDDTAFLRDGDIA